VPGEQPGIDERAQSIGEGLAGDAFVAREQLPVVALAREDDVAEDQERPSIAHDLEGEVDRTGRTSRDRHSTSRRHWWSAVVPRRTGLHYKLLHEGNQMAGERS